MIRMRFEGGEQLATRMRELSRRAGRQVALNALRAGAEPMRKRASDIAPREGGAPDLAENIVISNARDPEGEGPAVAVGPSTALRSDQRRRFGTQGRHLEFGTAHMAAQPFMRPAFDTEREATLAAIGRRMWASLRSETGGVNQGSRFL